MKYLILLSLLTLNAYADVQAEFIDNCSGDQVALTTPNGISLRVLIDDIDKTKTLNVKIKFRPVGIINDLDNMKHFDFIYRIDPRTLRSYGHKNSYRFKVAIPKDKMLIELEDMHQSKRIWDAQILWWQETKPQRSGSTFSSFMRVLPGETSFYQITGPNICTYEAMTAVSSKYYENEENDYLTIGRTYDNYLNSSWQRGIALGPTNMVNAGIPLLSMSELDVLYGWFFKDWQKQFDRNIYVTVEKRWTLNRDEFAVFAKRYTFSRLPSKKYEWSYEGNNCGSWREKSEGYLDLGVEVEDLFVIPKTYYGSPEKVNDIIDKLHPLLDSCEDNTFKDPMVTRELIPNGFNGLMYYYPKYEK